MILEWNTQANIQFDGEDWEIEGKDYEEELRDAIKKAKAGEETIIDVDKMYLLKARPNEKTNSVWVSVYGYSLGLEAKENGEPVQLNVEVTEE